MKRLPLVRDLIEGNIFIVALIFWCITFTGFALMMSLRLNEQLDNNTLTKEALEFQNILLQEALEQEAQLSTLAIALNNSDQERFEDLSKNTFESNQHFVMLELRSESGKFLKSEISEGKSSIPKNGSQKELPPSVVMNFFKAIEQQKPYWAISYDAKGKPTLELIATGGKQKNVLIAQVDPTSWITDKASVHLPQTIQVSLQERNSVELTPSNAISLHMGLTGLDVQLVFRNLISRPVGVDLSSGLIIFLGTALVVLLIRFNIEIKSSKKAREQLAFQELALTKQAQLSTLGEISTTLAHELNQPLATITNYIATCEIRLRQLGFKDMALEKALNDARAQALRAGEVVQSIRNFLRKGHSVKATVEIENSVANLMPILKSLVKENRASIDVKVEPDLCIRIDPALFEQILLNLCKNGLDAMRETPENQRKLVIKSQSVTTANNKDVVEITVRDFGHGIQNADAHKLFDAFFTTKIEGMGIGLSLVKSLTESHGGKIHWENNADMGATFILQFPKYTPASSNG